MIVDLNNCALCTAASQGGFGQSVCVRPVSTLIESSPSQIDYTSATSLLIFLYCETTLAEARSFT